MEINGNMELTEDTEYNEDLIVHGNIYGKDGKRYNLKVNGNITCGNITCWNIDCLNITCGNITCKNIDCWNIACKNITCGNITCLNINAFFILCETIRQKKGSKLIAKNLITKRSGYVQKEIKLKEVWI